MGEKAVNQESPESLFFESLIKGTTAGTIEGQEARGQHSFVTSDTLPVDGLSRCRPVLEAAGAVFGEVCPKDPIFQFVTLPPGWSKKPTDHSMWSILVDAEGKERAAIFYKAAFYDRSAHILLSNSTEE